MHVGGHAGKQTVSQLATETGRQTGRQTVSQLATETGRQTGRQTCKQKDSIRHTDNKSV